jgi:Mg-chelatase subunit ChlD
VLEQAVMIAISVATTTRHNIVPLVSRITSVHQRMSTLTLARFLSVRQKIAAAGHAQIYHCRSRTLDQPVRTMPRFVTFACLVVVCSSVLACAEGSSSSDDAVSASYELKASKPGRGSRAPASAPSSSGGDLVADIAVIDAAKRPVPISEESRVTVETRAPGASWVSAKDVVVERSSSAVLDVVVVADNSGSVKEEVSQIKDAIRHFSGIILARSHRDRIGLVRVSTEAAVVSPLTDDEASLNTAVDRLFAGRGWTALWDGVRLANETLSEAATTSLPSGSRCYSGASPSVIVITDGGENNSLDQHETRYPGDGVDTTLTDLLGLSVRDRPTTIHTVSVGDDADVKSLQTLATTTGGHYAAIENYGQLSGALHRTAAKLDATVPVCFQPASCSDREARITVSVKPSASPITAIVPIAPDC